ncbi:hypothetical protein [Caballeronia telluris]|uniref:hypothetical protein n=1 Tax=Caballeronia telluris TaxID=326475 RepID=UPI000A913CD5|nr:hypothetical protein [Caballeronia telluris]
MDHYFTTEQGAIQLLIRIRRYATGTSGPSIVVGKKTTAPKTMGSPMSRPASVQAVSQASFIRVRRTRLSSSSPEPLKASANVLRERRQIVPRNQTSLFERG